MKTPKVFIYFLLLLVIITLFKAYYLNGGFVIGEPDERNYVTVVNNFKTTLLPSFDGEIFFHSPPLFHYFSFLVSLVISTKFIALRIVSLISSFLLGLTLYWYLRPRVSQSLAVFGGLLISFTPLVVYYSRLGLIDMQLTFLTFLYISVFEKSLISKNRVWSILTGLGMSLAMLTKYSIIPLVFLPGIVFGLKFLQAVYKTRSLQFVFEKDFKAHIINLFFAYGTAFLIFAPITYFNYSLDPGMFKAQLHQDFALGKRSLDFSLIKVYLELLPSFIGWLPLILFLIGIIPLVSNLKKNLVLIISLSFLTYTIIKVSLFQPRYFLVLLPFMLVVAIYGLNWLKEVWKNKFITLTVQVLGLISLIPGFILAINASHHTIIEEVGNYIKQENKANQWVASNFWPSAFVDEVGYKVTWYSTNQSDSASLSGGGSTKYIYPPDSSVELISKEGGWVVVESLYSRSLSSTNDRIIPIKNLEKDSKPVKVFVDNQPNWPFFKDSTNTLSIYHLNPK